MILEFLTVLSLIVIGAISFLCTPLFGKYYKSDLEGKISLYRQSLQEKQILLDQLRDLELDFQMGKIEKDDYKNLRTELFQLAGQKETELEKLDRELK